MNAQFWSDRLAGLADAIAYGVVITAALVAWRGLKRSAGDRPLARAKGKRASSPPRVDASELWAALSTADRTRVAVGCLLLVLLDQCREPDEPDRPGDCRIGWGWGDSESRVLGAKLDPTRDPKWQPSPGFTALVLSVLGRVWPSSNGERPVFLTSGAQYLINHQSATGGINRSSGSSVAAGEIVGKLRHAAHGSVALATLDAPDNDYGKAASLAMSFTKSRWDSDPWDGAREDFLALTAGAVRRAVWYWARSERSSEWRDWSREFIGMGHDAQVIQRVVESVVAGSNEPWRERASWDEPQNLECYPGRASGPDSTPDSTLAFLVWSPCTADCIPLIERVAEAARMRRTADGGIQLYGSAHGELGSAASLAHVLLAPDLRGRMDSHDWQRRYGSLGKELLSWSVENFWDPEIQKDAGLPAWLWLLDTLILDEEVLAALSALDPFDIDAIIRDIRGDRPRLYYCTPPEVLERVRQVSARLLGGQ